MAETLACPVCRHPAPVGTLVCAQCAGTITYGATRKERLVASLGGGVWGAVLYAYACHVVQAGPQPAVALLAAGLMAGASCCLVIHLQRGTIRTWHRATRARQRPDQRTIR